MTAVPCVVCRQPTTCTCSTADWRREVSDLLARTAYGVPRDGDEREVRDGGPDVDSASLCLSVDEYRARRRQAIPFPAYRPEGDLSVLVGRVVRVEAMTEFLAEATR